VLDPDPDDVGFPQAIFEVLGELLGRSLQDDLELRLTVDLAVQQERGQMDAQLLERGVVDDILDPGEIHGPAEPPCDRPRGVGHPA
jgi:hypothetical protein